MNVVRRHPWIGVLAVTVVLFGLMIGAYGMYLASEAGRLPWQVDPTRIAITPFADIPGFSAPTPTPTPVQTTVTTTPTTRSPSLARAG